MERHEIGQLKSKLHRNFDSSSSMDLAAADHLEIGLTLFHWTTETLWLGSCMSDISGLSVGDSEVATTML